MSAQKSAFARIANLDKTKLATQRVNLSFVSEMVEQTTNVNNRLREIQDAYVMMESSYELVLNANKLYEEAMADVQKAEQELVYEINDAGSLMNQLEGFHKTLNVAMDNFVNAAKELGISPTYNPDYDNALIAYEDATEALATLGSVLNKYEKL
jgi:hypothetical protein